MKAAAPLAFVAVLSGAAVFVFPQDPRAAGAFVFLAALVMARTAVRYWWRP